MTVLIFAELAEGIIKKNAAWTVNAILVIFTDWFNSPKCPLREIIKVVNISPEKAKKIKKKSWAQPPIPYNKPLLFCSILLIIDPEYTYS